MYEHLNRPIRMDADEPRRRTWIWVVTAVALLALAGGVVALHLSR